MLEPRAIAATAAIALYVLTVAVQVVPGSPWYAVGRGDNVERAYFGQRWNLFVRPPSANLATYVVVRYRDRDGTHVTKPADLSSAVRDASRRTRWAPPRLARVVTKLNVALERQAYDDARLAGAEHIDPSSPPGSFVARVTARRERTVEVYRRLLSSVAAGIVPAGATVVDVRGLVVRTTVNRFDRRDEPPVRAIPAIGDPDAPARLVSADVLRHVRSGGRPLAALVFDSGWLAHERDVEPFRVAPR